MRTAWRAEHTMLDIWCWLNKPNVAWTWFQKRVQLFFSRWIYTLIINSSIAILRISSVSIRWHDAVWFFLIFPLFFHFLLLHLSLFILFFSNFSLFALLWVFKFVGSTGKFCFMIGFGVSTSKELFHQKCCYSLIRVIIKQQLRCNQKPNCLFDFGTSFICYARTLCTKLFANANFIALLLEKLLPWIVWSDFYLCFHGTICPFLSISELIAHYETNNLQHEFTIKNVKLIRKFLISSNCCQFFLLLFLKLILKMSIVLLFASNCVSQKRKLEISRIKFIFQL